MPRKQKKYHYIYKTTCITTNKFYVCMHSTDNLEDGYLGSGKILVYSRNKYGDDNHIKEILEHCSSRDELKQREKEIVNEELIANPLNINLKYGGEGGWDHLVLTNEQRSELGRRGGFANRNSIPKESLEKIIAGQRKGAEASKAMFQSIAKDVRTQYLEDVLKINFKKPGWTHQLRKLTGKVAVNKWLRRYFPEIWKDATH